MSDHPHIGDAAESPPATTAHADDGLFFQLFDASPFPAVVTRLSDNRVLAINQRTSSVFGIPQDDAVDREVRGWRGQEPVTELSATGFGTLARRATQSVSGMGRNAKGEWQVVLRRDMNTGSPDDTMFRPGSGSFLILAVWNGSNREVNGKKSVTLRWTPVAIEPTLVARRHEVPR